MQNNTAEVEILLEPRALARMFRVSERTVRRWWQSGQFPAPLRCGRRCLRFRLKDINDYLSKKENHDDTFTRIPEARNRAALPR